MGKASLSWKKTPLLLRFQGWRAWLLKGWTFFLSPYVFMCRTLPGSTGNLANGRARLRGANFDLQHFAVTWSKRVETVFRIEKIRYGSGVLHLTKLIPHAYDPSWGARVIRCCFLCSFFCRKLRRKLHKACPWSYRIGLWWSWGGKVMKEYHFSKKDGAKRRINHIKATLNWVDVAQHACRFVFLSTFADCWSA